MYAIKLFKMADDVIYVCSKEENKVCLKPGVQHLGLNLQYNTALKVALGGKVGEISLY